MFMWLIFLLLLCSQAFAEPEFEPPMSYFENCPASGCRYTVFDHPKDTHYVIVDDFTGDDVRVPKSVDIESLGREDIDRLFKERFKRDQSSVYV